MKGKIAAACVLGVAWAVAVFVSPWEGRRLTPYQDIVGVWTVCEGITRNVEQRRYTDAECDALLEQEVALHLVEVAKCINRPLTEGQWVAVGSWVFNIGSPAACRSTLVRQINAGQPPGVWCRQLLRWDRAGGKQVRGLTRRRQAEYRVCVGD